MSFSDKKKKLQMHLNNRKRFQIYEPDEQKNSIYFENHNQYPN
jgi:hypothetical protein